MDTKSPSIWTTPKKSYWLAFLALSLVSITALAVYAIVPWGNDSVGSAIQDDREPVSPPISELVAYSDNTRTKQTFSSPFLFDFSITYDDSWDLRTTNLPDLLDFDPENYPDKAIKVELTQNGISLVIDVFTVMGTVCYPMCSNQVEFEQLAEGWTRIKDSTGIRYSRYAEFGVDTAQGKWAEWFEAITPEVFASELEDSRYAADWEYKPETNYAICDSQAPFSSVQGADIRRQIGGEETVYILLFSAPHIMGEPDEETLREIDEMVLSIRGLEHASIIEEEVEPPISVPLSSPLDPANQADWEKLNDYLDAIIEQNEKFAPEGAESTSKYQPFMFDTTDFFFSQEDWPAEINNLKESDLLGLNCDEAYVYDYEDISFFQYDSDENADPRELNDTTVASFIKHGLHQIADTYGVEIALRVDSAGRCLSESGLQIGYYRISQRGGGAGTISFWGLLNEEGVIADPIELRPGGAPYSGCSLLALTKDLVSYAYCGGGDGGFGQRDVRKLNFATATSEVIWSCSNQYYSGLKQSWPSEDGYYVLCTKPITYPNWDQETQSE